MTSSGDEDASIDDLSDGDAAPSDDGSLIDAASDDGSLMDASTPSDPGSPVLGGARVAGRGAADSQPAPAAALAPNWDSGSNPASPRLSQPGPGPDPAPGNLNLPSPGPVREPSPDVIPLSPPGLGSGSPAGPGPPGPSTAGPSSGPGPPTPAPPGGPADVPDGATIGERMDTATDGDGGSSDMSGDADSDVEIVPVEETEPPPRVADAPVAAPAAVPAARRSIGASAVWRDTDFQEPGPGQPAVEEAVPAAAVPERPAPEESVSAAGGQVEQHRTPDKAEGGGFVAGADSVKSPGSEDGQVCTICFESWSNSGEHRIASLRCGHLFGKSCIERWLRGREQRCPQCNAKACRRDVRVIFAKSLRVLDTTDRDRALEELDREREARRRLELDFAVVQVKCQMKENQIAKLQAELRALRDRVSAGGWGGGVPLEDPGSDRTSPQPAGGGAKLSLQCTIDVSRAGGCRVLEHNSWLGMLVASQPSQNALFPGHGVRKINTLDMRAMQFVSLHQKQIRDVRFSPEQRDLLLSVSLDRRAKITNVCGNSTVQAYDCPAPVWSCAWDRDAPHVFYCGLQSGEVLGFDTRAGTEPLVRLEGGSPVVALQHVPRGGEDGSGGLLVCRLADCVLQEVTGQMRAQALPLQGPFVSADFDSRTRHLLVSSRPSSRQPHAQHAVCRLRRTAGRPLDTSTPPAAAELVQVFRGGTSQRVLSRSALVPHPLRPAAPLVCASQETAQVTQLWDLGTGECAATLAASEPVLDASPLTAQDRHFLALLSERAVKMYRWEVT